MSSTASKLYKKALIDQQRRIKPGECIKYVRLVLDDSFTFSNFGREFLSEIAATNFKHVSRSIGENCIYWERSLGQREFISDNDLAVCNEKWEMENHVVKLLKAHELKLHIQQRTLAKLGKEFHAAFPGKRLSIIVPRIKDKDNETVNNYAQTYVEMQVLEDVSVIQVTPTAKDLTALICRFTKAIAEIPFKQQKSESMNAFKKFVANDKKQCVRVMGHIGLGRLWQQHLIRLPMVTLEVAEAIVASYNCPKKLLQAYKDNPNAIVEIGDLRLNRFNGPQPLQTDRRIGNVLSTKLHTLYNSRDPNTCI